jgi:hypothetical protein
MDMLRLAASFSSLASKLIEKSAAGKGVGTLVRSPNKKLTIGEKQILKHVVKHLSNQGMDAEVYNDDCIKIVDTNGDPDFLYLVSYGRLFALKSDNTGRLVTEKVSDSYFSKLVEGLADGVLSFYN